MKILSLKFASLLVAASALTACALPHSGTRSGTQRPSLAIIGAPPGAQLRLDGVLIGDATQYDGHGQILTIEEGMHTVLIESQGAVLYTAKVYAAGGETTRVEVGAETHR
jgi:hypothetical protein